MKLIIVSQSEREDLETGSETLENTYGLITITVRINRPASMFSAWMLGVC